ATHKNLQAMVDEKLFRNDLYYRLNVFELELPPLRARGDDSNARAATLLTKMSKRIHRRSMTLSSSAYQVMSEYNWPGNVRELENIIERAVILSRDNCIDANDLALAKSDQPLDLPTYEFENKLSLDEYFVSFVKRFQQEYNETELAKMLGISRKNLWERRQRLEIPARK
ncbi:MAG: sigma-54-dependent Fis family transcriptional regulator, partial [Gammaproteobacteria bacterium]|nr:sigma-54-dependent Fis family transcriptional regulator [Gammaproteobacteria bacterium]